MVFSGSSDRGVGARRATLMVMFSYSLSYSWRMAATRPSGRKKKLRTESLLMSASTQEKRRSPAPPPSLDSSALKPKTASFTW